ncbi:MAG: metallopeptidase family protein [Anaerolineae bacterium]
MIDPRAFEALAVEALDSLPDGVAAWLDNIEVVVEDWPTRDQLDLVGLEKRGDLLGIYEGVPLTERSADYGLVLPDRVTVFRKPLLAVCSTPAEVRREVRRTVLHELAHHFGIDDERLDELGAY